MPLIKQKDVRRNLSVIRELIENEEVEEEFRLDCKSVDEFLDSSYSIILSKIEGCCSSCKDVLKLFDYFYFKVLASDYDFSKESKKLMKKLEIESEGLLLVIKHLVSKMLREAEFDVPYELLNPEESAYVLLINGFILFLYYVFDLAFDNKPLSVGKLKCKNKDLDEPIKLCSKTYRNFNDELVEVFNSITELRNPSMLSKKLKLNVDEVDRNLATFQHIKLKYDYLTINQLIKKLLKDEWVNYLDSSSLGEVVLSSLLSECQANECDLELHPKFYKLLKKRAYLLPTSGISIKTHSMDTNIVIDLYERQLNDDNYLVICLNLRGIYSFMIINLNKEFMVGNVSQAYEICNFLYHFYKLDEVSLNLFGERFANDPHLVVSFKLFGFLADPVVTIKGTSDLFDDFTVEVPYYWKFRGKSYGSENKKAFTDSCKAGVFKYVSAFKRRLPKGSKISDSAKMLAEKYCVELEEGETIVSPFEREYKVKVK